MPLAEAMQSPAPMAGIPMSMTVVPYRGKGSTALVSIAVEIHAEDGPPRPASKPIEVVTAAAKVNAKAGDVRRIAVGGGTIVARMDLKPGRYHLRVGALDTADTRRGSLLYDVDVPDFSNGPLAMSGIALGSVDRPVPPVLGSDDRWKQTLGVPPRRINSGFPDCDALFETVYETRETD